MRRLRHNMIHSLCEAWRLIFSLSILHIRLAVKGKLVERRGRKATGLLSPSHLPRRRHDSGVARMYNTNLFYVPSPAHDPVARLSTPSQYVGASTGRLSRHFLKGREGMIE